MTDKSEGFSTFESNQTRWLKQLVEFPPLKTIRRGKHVGLFLTNQDKAEQSHNIGDLKVAHVFLRGLAPVAGYSCTVHQPLTGTSCMLLVACYQLHALSLRISCRFPPRLG